MSGDDPWLDMSAYPNLPPDDAVDGHTLHALRGLLHAPAEPELDPGAWNHLLDIAVHGDPDATAADTQGGHGAAGHGSDTHHDWRSHLEHPHDTGHGAHGSETHPDGHDDGGEHGGHGPGIHW